MTGANIPLKSYTQNEIPLFSYTLGELIPEDHKARVVNTVINNLDISGIMSKYKGGGTSSYHPRMLLKVITYSYLNNVYSGRKMESLLKENVVYMWLAGNNKPNFRTINLFRSERLDGAFDDIFSQIVVMLNEEGLVTLDTQYVDGTKIESVANKYTFVWRKRVEKDKARLESGIRSVLDEAERVLAEELEEEEPAAENSVEDINSRIDNLLSKMDKAGISKGKQRKAVEEVKKKKLPKLDEYEVQLERMGDRNSYSKTDPDATFMRMKEDHMMNGQTKPGYNAQISTENQFITNYGIFQRPGDTGTFIPFMESFKERYGKQSKTVVADSGYGSEQNYEYIDKNTMEGYVKYNMYHAEKKEGHRQDIFHPDNLFYNKEGDYYVCPMGQHMEKVNETESLSDLGYTYTKSVYQAKNCKKCPLRDSCNRAAGNRKIEVNHKNNAYRAKARELLDSEQGRYYRGRRSIEPEAVFGQIKHNHNFRRFHLKSLKKSVH